LIGAIGLHDQRALGVRFLARCLALRPFFCHSFLIEHKRSPNFRWVTLERQSESSMGLAGQRVNMVAARTDAAKVWQ
jgi:hypothetical protein